MTKKGFLILYLVVACVELFAEYFFVKPLLIVLKPLLPILLLVDYSIEYKKPSLLFSAILITSAITNLLFVWIDSLIVWGVIVFSIHRVLMIVFLIRIIKIKDFFPLILAFIPFFMFSVFILMDVNFENDTIFYLSIFHNFMISILGGLALSQYVLKDSFGITWLMLSVFLFFSLHYLVFIELFYVRNQFMRPLAMLLNVTAYYTFYRFVVNLNREIK
jgi:hypothetical protein